MHRHNQLQDYAKNCQGIEAVYEQYDVHLPVFVILGS